MSIKSNLSLRFLIRPARFCFQSHTARVTLWVWDPCLCTCVFCIWVAVFWGIHFIFLYFMFIDQFHIFWWVISKRFINDLTFRYFNNLSFTVHFYRGYNKKIPPQTDRWRFCIYEFEFIINGFFTISVLKPRIVLPT